MADRIDEVIYEAVQTLGQTLKGLGEDPYILEAAMKIVVRDLVHELVGMGVFVPDLAEHLDDMARLIREQYDERLGINND